MKNLQDAGIDNVFFGINPVEKWYAIFSEMLRQQRKSDVMTSFGLSVSSAVYYEASSPLCQDNMYRHQTGEDLS
jgi:hypothetical protein